MKRNGASVGMEVLAAFAVVLGAYTAPASAVAQTSAEAAPQTDDKTAIPVATRDAVVADDSVALEADTLSEEKTPHRVIAEGDVEANYQGRILRADRVVYNLDTKRVHASGNVQVVDADGSIRFAEELEVDDKLRDGVATRFAAKLPGDATVIANSAIRKEGDKTLLGQVIYTACPICDAKGKPQKPTWTVRARRATQNQKTKMISYRDAVIQIGSVPVIYLPYFTHADPTAGRRSGLLPPSISQSTSFGFSYSQPYYWAISPSQDLTVAPRFMSSAAPLLGAKYRKRFYSGDLDVEGSYTEEKLFDSDGNKYGDKEGRGHVYARGVWDINNNWKWGFGIEEVSDDLYTIRYRIDGEDRIRGPFQTRPNSLIDQLYVEGRDETSSTQIAAMKFNDLTLPRDRAVLPQVLPYISYLKHLESPVLGGQVTLDANAAGLTRSSTGVDSQRTSFGVAWNRRQILGPGIVLEPFAEGRADYFKISDYPLAGSDESFGRGYAAAGTVVRWPFRRSGAVDLIVEPIAMLTVGTENPNDARIPNEDSPSFELDETALFRGNAAPNYDLVEGGTRGSLGLRVSASAGKKFDGTAFIGRRWSSSTDSTFSDASNLGRTSSDYIAAIETNFAKRLRMNVRMRLDGEDFGLQRIDAGASSYIGPLSMGVRYYKYTAALVAGGAPAEQAQIGGTLALTKNYKLAYSLTRDFGTNTNLNQRMGFIFSDNCTTIGLYYDRNEIENRQIGPSEGFILQITLATLGSLSNEQANEYIAR